MGDMQVATSLEHPLAYHEHCKGWLPHHKWPGRTLPYGPPMQTGLWCMSWAKASGDDPIDFNFRYDMPVRNAMAPFQIEKLARQRAEAGEE